MKTALIALLLCISLATVSRLATHGSVMFKLLTHAASPPQPFIVGGLKLADGLGAASARAGQTILPRYDPSRVVMCEAAQSSPSITHSGHPLGSSPVATRSCTEDDVMLTGETVRGNVNARVVSLIASSIALGYLEAEALHIAPSTAACLFAIGSIWIDRLEIPSDSSLTLVSFQGSVNVPTNDQKNLATIDPTQTYRGSAWRSPGCEGSEAWLEPSLACVD